MAIVSKHPVLLRYVRAGVDGTVHFGDGDGGPIGPNGYEPVSFLGATRWSTVPYCRRYEAIGARANQIANRYGQKPIIATGPVNCPICRDMALSSGVARPEHLALM
jgi:hypothetical protein